MAGFPLEGLKVLDFSRVLAGPFATRMLSDLGADVIKVEPPEGDVTRNFGKRNGDTSGFYLQQNIGKRNICLDMKADGARALVLQLAEKADLVVENFRPGVMDKFGIGWSDLQAVNPKLVMLSISGFGQEGPERRRPAYAPVLHAETGLLARQAQIVGGPAGDIQFSMADSYSSLHGLVAALSALRMVEHGGEGQHIDIAMLNVMHATDDYAHYALDEIWPKAEEGAIWEGPGGTRILITGDMKWLWHVFSTRDGLQDPTPPGADIETKIALRRKAIEDRVTSFADFDALTNHLDELNLPWGKVREFGEDSYSQTSVEARGIVVDVQDETGAPRKTVQSPYKFSNAKSGITSADRAPGRGEHNSDALSDWLGLSGEEVSGLTDIGVLLAAEPD